DVIDDIRDKDPGSRVRLQIRRNGETQEVRAKLVDRDEAFRNVRRTFRAQDSDSDRNDMPGFNRGYSSNAGDLASAVQALQQQVAQLRREVAQLRQQQGGESHRAGYRGTSEREAIPAPATGVPSAGGGSTVGEGNSQDRNAD